MSSPGRLCLLIIALSVASALIVYVSSRADLDHAEGDRVRQGDALGAILGWQDPEDDSLRRAHINAIIRRWSAKERVMADLFARRITLLEAAARFRDLQLSNPPFDWSTWRFVMHNRFPNAADDDECMCRHVIDAMDARFSEVSEEAPLVLARLEAELNDYLRRGKLQLRPPAPPQADTSPEPDTISPSAPYRQCRSDSACR